MIIVFDLDDTLYDEITYVRSSLFEVAVYLSGKLQIPKDIIYANLNEVLKKKGRGKVFDIVLNNYDIYSKTEVNKCLSIYRNNNPKIKLFDQAIDCLERFSDFRKYLVTDGNKIVQKKKIEALKVLKKDPEGLNGNIIAKIKEPTATATKFSEVFCFLIPKI